MQKIRDEDVQRIRNVANVEWGERILGGKVLGIQEQIMGVLVSCGDKFSVYSKGEWEEINWFQARE